MRDGHRSSRNDSYYSDRREVMRDHRDSGYRSGSSGDYGGRGPGGRGPGPGGRAGGPRGGREKPRIFIALFDYDPPTMSPNPDACDEELPFSEGQLIKVGGEH